MIGMKLYKTRNKFIKRHIRTMKKALKEQLRPVIEHLKYQTADQLQVDLLISDEPIKTAYTDVYKDVGKTFGQNVNKFIRQKNKIQNLQLKGIEDDIWMQMMNDWCLQECGKRITQVSAYTRQLVKEKVQAAIDRGISQGMSIRQISDDIMSKLPREYNKLTAWRAKRIAQTEVISASNMASVRAAEQTGLSMKKRWVTRPYGFALSIQNERHALLTDLEEQEPKLNEPFIVDGEPLQYPGDPAGSPGNVINCHCVQTFEVI